MQFYELTHPEHESDRAYETSNPVRMKHDVMLPGLICNVCADQSGGAWSGSRRLYLPIKDENLRKRLNAWPLPEEQWMALAQAVREHIGLPDDYALEPGDVLGAPTAELLNRSLPDMVHAGTGEFIVKRTVVDALSEAGLDGFQPIPVEVSWAKKITETSTELPELYILQITGHVWREGVDKKSITVCTHCGRRTFPDWQPITENVWTGSDFFNIDMNPNMVFVTERVCELLAQYGFTNYRCRPIA